MAKLKIARPGKKKPAYTAQKPPSFQPVHRKPIEREEVVLVKHQRTGHYVKTCHPFSPHPLSDNIDRLFAISWTKDPREAARLDEVLIAQLCDRDKMGIPYHTPKDPSLAWRKPRFVRTKVTMPKK